MHGLDNDDKWDLRDKSRRPRIIHKKISRETEEKIISIRNTIGWGENKIADFVDVSSWSVNKILNKQNLTETSKRKKKRIKYVRWQRKHPNSLWQIDHSDQKIKNKYVISVLDECSRKSLAFLSVNSVTTNVVIKLIDDLVRIYGKPRQILTDNGSTYGSKSKHSRFDRKLKIRKIEHIRGEVRSPITQGKVERLFQTFKREFRFYNGDSELWRMRYNHFRPHTSLDRKTPDEVFDDFGLLF